MICERKIIFKNFSEAIVLTDQGIMSCSGRDPPLILKISSVVEFPMKLKSEEKYNVRILEKKLSCQIWLRNWGQQISGLSNNQKCDCNYFRRIRVDFPRTEVAVGEFRTLITCCNFD